jgi:hypothetical protein
MPSAHQHQLLEYMQTVACEPVIVERADKLLTEESLRAYATLESRFERERENLEAQAQQRLERQAHRLHELRERAQTEWSEELDKLQRSQEQARHAFRLSVARGETTAVADLASSFSTSSPTSSSTSSCTLSRASSGTSSSTSSPSSSSSPAEPTRAASTQQQSPAETVVDALAIDPLDTHTGSAGTLPRSVPARPQRQHQSRSPACPPSSTYTGAASPPPPTQATARRQQQQQQRTPQDECAPEPMHTQARNSGAETAPGAHSQSGAQVDEEDELYVGCVAGEEQEPMSFVDVHYPGQQSLPTGVVAIAPPSSDCGSPSLSAHVTSAPVHSALDEHTATMLSAPIDHHTWPDNVQRATFASLRDFVREHGHAHPPPSSPM